MVFQKQKMNKAEIESSKLYKDILHSLDGLDVVKIDNNKSRTFKIPATTISAVVYDLTFSTGAELELYVLKDGKVGRVSLNRHNGTDKTIASITDKDEDLGVTPQSLAKDIKRLIFAEQKTEAKAKINKRSMAKLVDEVSHLEIDTRLVDLKQDLQKGSGKFIALNKDGEFHGINGWTKKQSEIKTFDEIEDAKAVEAVNKVVEL